MRCMLWSNQPWIGESTFLQTPSLHPVTHHSTMAALKSVEKQKGLCNSGEHRVDVAPVRDGRQWLSQVSPSQSYCNSCAPPLPQHSSDTLWGSPCQVADAHCRFGRRRFRKFLLQNLFISSMAVPGVCQCMLQQMSWCPCKAERGPWEMCKGCHCSLHGARGASSTSSGGAGWDYLQQQVFVVQDRLLHHMS